VKKASPSAGLIRADFDPVEIGQTYELHGASCISILTDEQYFAGSLDDLRRVRAAAGVPCLRKDFILDRYQLYEARSVGADAVLLIAECLDDCNLRALFNEAVALGMTPLVELYEPENLKRVFDAGATLIGVNNRNLKTMRTDLEHTLRLRERIPGECVLVSESGIQTRADVARLEAAGVDAILVGESLMREADIGLAIQRLLGRDP
jgi:indole-3-glycerol phosphate synthase